MGDRARAIWARTRLLVWPGRYRIVSLPRGAAADAADLVSSCPGFFAALVAERDEVSLTIEEGAWSASALRRSALSEDGPWGAITLDVRIDLDVTGYLAPAAAKLAGAGIPIVPQCGYLKDHLLVPAGRLHDAVRLLEDLIRDCAD